MLFWFLLHELNFATQSIFIKYFIDNRLFDLLLMFSIVKLILLKSLHPVPF